MDSKSDSIKPAIPRADLGHRRAEARHALMREIECCVIAAEHRAGETEADFRPPALKRVVQDAEVEERPPCARVLVEQIVAETEENPVLRIRLRHEGGCRR